MVWDPRLKPTECHSISNLVATNPNHVALKTIGFTRVKDTFDSNVTFIIQ